jgi:hypothetical protein
MTADGGRTSSYAADVAVNVRDDTDQAVSYLTDPDVGPPRILAAVALQDKSRGPHRSDAKRPPAAVAFLAWHSLVGDS